jgi:hypothetical protein
VLFLAWYAAWFEQSAIRNFPAVPEDADGAFGLRWNLIAWQGRESNIEKYHCESSRIDTLVGFTASETRV